MSHQWSDSVGVLAKLPPRVQWLLEIAGFALLYYFTARFSLNFAFHHTNASPIWPPSALGLAVVLYRGRRLSPGIFLGAFLANTVVFSLNSVAGIPTILLASFIIGIGNTIEAVVGAHLVKRFINKINPFENTKDFLKFILIVPVACLLSSLIGPVTLVLLQMAPWTLYPSIWFTWWLGDTAGILTFAPLLLYPYRRKAVPVTDGATYLEGGVFLFILSIFSLVVFGEQAPFSQSPYILIPFMIWAGFRFGQIGVGLSILTILGIAVWHTVNGFGPFAAGTLNESLVLCQLFVGVVTATGLTLATTMTEKTATALALGKTENRYRRLVESTHIVAWEADAETGRFTYVGPQVEKLLGYPAEQWLGPTFWQDHIHPEDRAWAVEFYIESAQKFKEYEFEYRMIKADGNIIWLKDLVSLGMENNRQILNGFMIDITQRKEFEDKIAEYSEELTKRNQELEQFAVLASHDLQEPLRIISSYGTLLAREYKDKPDAKANQYINDIIDNTSRMQRLVADLLSYSRVGKTSEELKELDCKACALAAIKILEISIKECGAEVVCDILPRIKGSETQITHLFQNLISNAIKFRDKRPPRVHISAKDNGREWLFSVKDNGIGIKKEYFDQIFEIFRRLHTQKEYAGTGIGLAFCKKIVELHNGRIWVESEEGKGTTFYFTIPKHLV